MRLLSKIFHRPWFLVVCMIYIPWFIIMRNTESRRHIERTPTTHFLEYKVDLHKSGKYGIVYKAVTAEEAFVRDDVTIVTHLDASRLRNVAVLAKAWKGPIQATVYLTSMILWNRTMKAVRSMADLEPDVRKHVTWHVLFPVDFDSPPKSLVFHWHTCCSAGPHVGTPFECIIGKELAEKHAQFRDDMAALVKMTVSSGPAKSTDEHIARYPQNIAVNIAMQSCVTEFLLAIDSDVIPSMGMREKFLNFALDLNLFGPKQNRSTLKVGPGVQVVDLPEMKVRSYPMESVIEQPPGQPICAKHANGSLPPVDLYVIPTFEFKATAIPRTLDDLKRASDDGEARPFYMESFLPAYGPTSHDVWFGKSDFDSENEDVANEADSGLQRETDCVYEAKYFLHYEPFYIARNGIPLYDERFYGYAFIKSHQCALMASLGYRFKVLKNVFFIHDGWKVRNQLQDQKVTEVRELAATWKAYLRELDNTYLSHAQIARLDANRRKVPPVRMVWPGVSDVRLKQRL